MANRTELTLKIAGTTCDGCDLSINGMPGLVASEFESSAHHTEHTARVVSAASAEGDFLGSAGHRSSGQVTEQESTEFTVEKFSDAKEFDLVVVGGGSAGFAAAIRAADLGASAAVVEGGKLGGTCVNVGCVPSKTLIRAAEVFYRAGHHAFAGIRATLEPPNLKAIVDQKDELVMALQQSKYRDVLAGYPTVTLLEGWASLGPDGSVLVNGKPVHARKVVLATGARPWAPPIPGLADQPYLTSTEALSLTRLPKSMIVIGGSAVGLELAQFYARLGTRVTVLEALPHIVPAEDVEIGQALATYLRAEGLDIHPAVAIRGVSGRRGAYRVEVTEDDTTRTFEAAELLVATGRRPNTTGMGLEEAGVLLGKKGEVLVDEYLETTRKGIYAAGDVTGDPMFVYVAAYAGALAAENALRGNGRTYDLSVLPRVTFTDPAVASVGLTEAQARGRGMKTIVARLPLSQVPRALAARDTRGLVKLVADAQRNALLGAHILAPEAGEMIMEAALAIRFGIRVDEIGAIFHPYLTHAEGIKLACQTFAKDITKLSCCAT